MKYLFLSLLIIVAPVEAENFRFSQALVGGVGDGSIGVVALEPEVYSLSREDLGDLRLMRGGESIPYWIAPVVAEKQMRPPREIGSTITSFDTIPDGSIVVTLKLDEIAEITEVALEIPLQDFEKSVSLEVSVDGIAWTEVVTGAVLFDYREFVDFRRTGLRFANVSARWVRLRIDDATDVQRATIRNLTRTVSDEAGVTISESSRLETRAFRIDALRVYRPKQEREEIDDSITYPVGIRGRKQDPESKRTELLLNGGSYPLTELTLVTDDRNFRRDVELQMQSRDELAQWETVQRGPISRYVLDDWSEESLNLRFPETRAARYRILIKNGDSPALAIDSLEARGNAYEMLFSNDDGATTLQFGSTDEAMTRPDFDTAAFALARSREVPLVRYELGEIQNHEIAGAEPIPDPWWRRQELLWIVIALATGGLIAALFSALKKIDRIEK